MNSQKTKRLKKAYNNSTPGEWLYCVNTHNRRVRGLYSEYEDEEIDIADFEDWDKFSYPEEMKANAEFIVLAHELVPVLLEENEILTEGLMAVRASEEIMEARRLAKETLEKVAKERKGL